METDVELDTNMVQIKEGNNDSALVVYDSGTATASRNWMYGTPPTPYKQLESPNEFDKRMDESGRMAPFTPSKWQYREVGKSISLEKKCALMATNESPNEFNEGQMKVAEWLLSHHPNGSTVKSTNPSPCGRRTIP